MRGSYRLRDWTAFLAFAVLWSCLGRLALLLPIHPIAVAVIWLIGFVWGVGYIAAGKRTADRLTKVWLGTLAGTALFAALVVIAIS